MKTFHRSMLGSLIFILTTASNQAAFIIEASNEIDALGFGNFAYTGAGGTVASYSDTSVGNLPAYTDIPQTFFTLRHAFGGNGTTDQYTFTYTPALHADNFTVAPGTLYNSMGVNPNLTATGLTGGTAGIYNVYRIHPNTTNVSGGNTTYQVAVGASVQLTEVINQNYSSELAALGKNIGRWELIGSVSVANATDTVTVTMTPETSPFVSMRASGIMFEYVSPIPEPHAALLLGLSGLALLQRRRVRA